MKSGSENSRQASQAASSATWAGAAVADITPTSSVFLFGYPHVPRMSTGVHDPLECAALYLRGQDEAALFLANDLIFIPRDFSREVRRRIKAETGVPEAAIVLTATHTHSGPVMTDNLSNSADSVVPKTDVAYLAWLADRMVATAKSAVNAAVPAEIGLARARAEGVGTNRHDPAGPADPEVPVLVARARDTKQPIACMLVYAMHTTVLHEDSKLISADFPYYTREFLRQQALPKSCVILYHQGAAGNQSPRHVTKANTFAEAQRLGEKLGQSIAAVIPGIVYQTETIVSSERRELEVALRNFPAPAVAEENLVQARATFARLQAENRPRTAVRTAECDVFGAEKTALLSRAAADGKLAAAGKKCSPAEIQIIGIGAWRFVFWPGEFFVEYALAVKARARDTFVVTLTNGELQGYIVTPEAVERKVYEATNAVFAAENGVRFVEATLALLAGAK